MDHEEKRSYTKYTRENPPEKTYTSRASTNTEAPVPSRHQREAAEMKGAMPKQYAPSPPHKTEGNVPRKKVESKSSPTPIPPPRKARENVSQSEDPLINFEMDGGQKKGAPSNSQRRTSLDVGIGQTIDNDVKKTHPVKGISIGKSMDPSSLASKSTAAQEGMKARESNLRQSTEKAILFKRNLDQMEKRDQEQYEAASKKHDAALKVWAEDAGKKRNIRTLLSTMHTVLWPGARWTAVSLADLIVPNKVKIKYRKALLVVHPDHNVNEDNEKRFIAKRVFEAINEAYTVFESAELNR